MQSSSIYISSKTALGNLENFLEAASGSTIVIEDKYRKSTGTIRFGIREKDDNVPEQAGEKAKTRQALYQAISVVLESNKQTAALSYLQGLVQSSGNCDALFIPDTTQLKSGVLQKLLEKAVSLKASPSQYIADSKLSFGRTAAMRPESKPGSGFPSHVIDRTLAPEQYLRFPVTVASFPTLKEIADKARSRNIETAQSDSQFSSIFVKDFERMHRSGAYSLENLDGSAITCPTLTAFAEFVGPGNGNGFKNGANLVTVVSYLTSQNLPIFLNQVILKSADTPIRSASGEPIFFNANLKGTYHLKKMADGGIMLTYKGICRPETVRRSSAHDAPMIALSEPGLVTIECDIIFKPNGDMDYGDVHVQAEGLNL